ncbi:MAG: sulfatase [Bacteroidales bacterium]|nr:sulfatase [Bacteroidales bacterium]
MKRTVIHIYLTFIALILITSCASEELAPPNILWLTSEDNNIDWVGCYGNEYAETPNIDALSEEGFRYTHCYANAPVCAPQRSTWITGMYALSMGTHPMRSRNPIPHDSIKYYPDHLKQAGYYVSNGYKTDYNIGGRPDRDCWDSMDRNENGQPIVDWEAIKENQPFFKIINFNESHESRAQGDVENTIHDPAMTDLRAYHPDLPDIRKNYAKYHDAVKRMDTQIGEMLAKLEELGLAENTIVVYCSDHGGVLPRSKRYLFASGIHTPLIVRIPEKYKAWYPESEPGSVVDRIVSFVDMPKTWLSLAGAEVPEYMQGDVFLGKNKDDEKDYHFAFRGRMDERNENARAVYDKEFVYIRNYMPYVPWMQHLRYLWLMKATGAWEEAAKSGNAPADISKYFYPKLYTEEFYSLNEDWDNTRNLINDPQYTDRINSMLRALRSWQLEIHDSGLLPESEMLKRAGDNNMTIFEMVRDPELYDLPGLLDAADLAMEQDAGNLDRLRSMLDDEDSGVRYWAMTGCFLLNDEVAAMKAMDDASHEVRALAAWTLIRTGNRGKGMNILEDMLMNGSYATLKILNIIDWMGEDGWAFKNTVEALELSPQEQSYEIRMQENLVLKFEG